MSDIEVTRNEAANRYEAQVDGRPAGISEYTRIGDRIVFPHTEVDPAFEGRGVASALARVSLDDARAEGLGVVPSCSFYEEWMAKHPEYEDLIVG